jgi:hypothetical protein
VTAGEEPAPVRRPSVAPGAVPRVGARAFLDLKRVDVIWLVALVLAAFVVRVASPVYLNFLDPSATQKNVAAAWGVGYPLNNDGCIDDVPIGPKHQPKRVCGFVFDEVYFPVDAAKDIAGVDYFDPEPPLAKLLMAPPIIAGGFNSGAWRTSTVLAGSLLVGLVYLIGRRLWRGDRFLPVAAGLFMAFDGLSFVESRTGVIDIIAIMFAALLWYAFLLHWQARTRRQWTATLYFMALCAGLAFGAKLTAIAPMVIAVVLLLGRFVEPLALELIPPLKRIRGPGPGAAIMWRDAAGGARAFLHYLLAIIVAVALFSACFSRYMTIEHTTVYHFDDCTQEAGLHLASTDTLHVPWIQVGRIRLPDVVQAERNIIDVMAAGLQYHNAECHGHPYASDWYSWPVVFHPVLFYADYKSNTTAAGVSERGWISDMGNPAVWWLAIPALLFCLWRALGGRGGWSMTVAAAGVLGFGMFYVLAYSTDHSRIRYLGIPVLLFGLWYALRRWWPIALGSLGLVALAEMIARYHVATRYDLVRVDVGLGFEIAFAAMVIFGGLLVVNAIVTRRFVPSFILLGYLAAWLMWVHGNERRVLFFYHMLGALIFMCLALAYALAHLRRSSLTIAGRRIPLASLAYAGIAVVLAAFVFFYPLWTAMPITNSDFLMRMWVASWQ